MIRYSRDSLFTLVYWWGGIIRSLCYPAFCYFLYVLCSYYVTACTGFRLNVERNSIHAVGGFVMFLFVFRLNTCMARHCKGNELSSAIFSDLEFFVQTFCSCTRGASELSLEAEDEKARRERRVAAELALTSKINCVRLVLALALAFVAHLWILDAVTGQDGELEGDNLCHVMFILARLEGLLYPEELKLMDEALCITREDSQEGEELRDSTAGDEVMPNARSRAAQWLRAASGFCESEAEPVVRAEANRHRLDASVVGERLIGRRSSHGELSVVPMSKVATQLLMDAVLQSCGLKWGYLERFASVFVPTLARVTNRMEELSRLVSQPLPLAYLQHCRCLLLLYAVAYPLSVDANDGVLENICVPLIVFITLFGFEVLSSQMESPVGLDEMDLNTLEMVHYLEVAAESAFDLSEAGRKASRLASQRPLEEFGMLAASEASMPEPAHAGTPVVSFSSYFSWQPLPTLILASLSETHGHVDTVHQAHLHGGSLRRLLRRSVIRRKQHDGGVYHQVGERDGCDVDRLADLRRDPMLWCHYLSLRRAPPRAGQGDAVGCREPHRPWSVRMEKMLRGTPAGAIFLAEAEDDAELTMRPTTRHAENLLESEGGGSGSVAHSCSQLYSGAARPSGPQEVFLTLQGDGMTDREF